MRRPRRHRRHGDDLRRGRGLFSICAGGGAVRALSHAAGRDPPHEFSNSLFKQPKLERASSPPERSDMRGPAIASLINVQTKMSSRLANIKTSVRVLAARCARVLERTFRPKRGRAGRRVPDAPAASCAKRGSTSAHESSQRRHRKTRQSRTRWFTMYAVLSSGRCSIAPVIPRIKVLSGPVGWTSLRRT